MKLNNAIPRSIHIAIVIALAIVGAITALIAKGQLQVEGPLAMILAIVTSILHSVDPVAASNEIPITTVRPPPPPPAAQRRILAPGMLLAFFVAGCTPAQFAKLDQIEQVVLADIQAGKSRFQVEQDVEAAMRLTGPIPVVVNIAVNAAIDLLVQLGYVPPGLLGQTQAIQLEEQNILMQSGTLKGCKP